MEVDHDSPSAISPAVTPDLSSQLPMDPRRRRVRLGTKEGATFVERYAGVGLLLALVALFTALRPHLFFTYPNFIGIAGNESVSGIVALGVLGVLAAGVFDISIGGMMTLAVVEVTWLFQTSNGHIPIVVAIGVTLLTAVAVGVINSLLVVKAKVDTLIATIGTGTVLTGISEWMGGGQTMTFHIPTGFSKIGRSHLHSVPITIFIFGALALVLWYVLSYTPAGRLLYATGAGREAARLSGVRTDRIISYAYVGSAIAATIAGIVFAARLGSGPPGAGTSYLLPAYATAYLGATMIKPGRFNVGGLIIGVLILAVGINGLQIMGIPFWVVDFFQGTALIIAVLLSKLQARRL